MIVYNSLAALAGCYGLPLLFGLIGFSSADIATGLVAAWWQSTHFLPSIFSLVQSATAATKTITTFVLGDALLKAVLDTKKNQCKTKDENQHVEF